MTYGKLTENQELLAEKMFLGETGPASKAALLFIADPLFGPAIATACTPNVEDGAMLFGEIERRWNVHNDLVTALRELTSEVTRDSNFSSVRREMFGPALERADQILTRIANEEAAAGITHTDRPT